MDLREGPGQLPCAQEKQQILIAVSLSFRVLEDGVVT